MTDWTSEPIYRISGTLLRINSETFFICRELPLAGIGHTGVESITTFFDALRTFWRHSPSPDTLLLEQPPSPPDGQGTTFTLHISEGSELVSGEVREVNSADLNVAECTEHLISGIGRGPLDVVESLLGCLRAYLLDSGVKRSFGYAMRDHLYLGGVAMFSMQGPDLAQSLVQEVFANPSLVRPERNRLV